LLTEISWIRKRRPLMTQRLLLRKTIVTTVLFIVFMYGSAQAQSSTEPSALPGPPAQVVTVPPTSQNTENAVVLLSRVQTIVEEAMSDTPRTKADRPLGTSGTLGKSGQVTIDRADLDEIRALVEQLKIALQTYKR